MTQNENKDQKLESLRCLAILLVVASHIDVWAGGPPPGLFSEIKHIVGFFRMPLFASISGYVYALRPLAPGSGLEFLRGKARRLLIPMFCLSPFFFILKQTPPYIEPAAKILEMWKISIFPVGQFWFLLALFLIFMVIVILETCKLIEKSSSWLLALGLATLPVLLLAGPETFKTIDLPFSLDGFLFLLPYFLFGMGLGRFKDLLGYRWSARLAAVLALFSLTLQIAVLMDRIKIPDHKGSLFYVCTSLACLFFLFKFKAGIGWLAALGKYSYSIFLYHIQVILAGRIILSRATPLLAPGARYGIILLCAFALPILAHVVFQRYALTRRLLLGLR